MKVTGNTILITGGGSGIGLALTKRFAERGNTVIICGRRQDALAKAAVDVPGIHTRVGDVASADGRVKLFEWATNEYPDLNVLVNNAGIQRRVDMTVNDEAWGSTA